MSASEGEPKPDRTEDAPSRRFDGQVALVTGGTAGIGLAVVEQLAAGGARVVVMARDGDRGRERLAAVEGAHDVELVAGDVATDASTAVRRVGAIDLLVNNAGANVGGRHLTDLTDEDWDHMHAVNLRGAFAMTRAVADGMIGLGHGSIVCVSSIAARGFRQASNAGYAAMKGGLISFVQVAAMQLGPSGIRVNCVCPGPTRTEAFVAAVAAAAARDGIEPALAEERMVARFGAAMNRVVEPREVAATISFLLSREASGITGQTLNVDAGIQFG